MFPQSFEIIDITQPITSRTACFPGDVPFSKQLTLSYEQSGVFNLTAMTLSPHVGTHADAPSHIEGNISDEATNIGAANLAPYIGSAMVIDIAPLSLGPVTTEHIKSAMGSQTTERLLVKTQAVIDYENWQGDYPYFSLEAIEYLNKQGVRLVGIDSPSVDQVHCKSLKTHHALHSRGMYWLENLDLTRVQAGVYFLLAAPLKLMELEAGPVRAVLLR